MALTVVELQNYCQGLGLHKTRKELSDLRFDWEFMATRTPFRRTGRWVGSQIDKLGVIMVSRMAENVILFLLLTPPFKEGFYLPAEPS